MTYCYGKHHAGRSTLSLSCVYTTGEHLAWCDYVNWILDQGGYSSIIWVEMCSEMWKVDPFLFIIWWKIRHFFILEPQISNKFCYKFHIVFKIAKFWSKFWYQTYEIQPIFAPIFKKFWKYDPSLNQFLHWRRGTIIISGGWFWDPFQQHVPG